MQCNTAGRDLVSVVRDFQAGVDAKIKPALKEGYFVEYGVQFEARQDANRRLLLLGSFSMAAVFLLLYKCLASWQAALQVMANIPQAAMGSVIALLLVNRPAAEALAGASWWQIPGIWIGATDLSVARRDILPYAKQALELTRAGYEQGEFTYLELLIAQQTFSRTNLAYVSRLRELWLASVQIHGMLLSGGLEAPGR